MANTELRQRILKLMQQASVGIFEKENVFKLATLAMLTGESIFLLGKPGVAKSLVSRRMKYLFCQANVFENLMNRFSTPEEIFGPISITDLQNGIYRRLTTNYLPSADIVFLDEIWKAGPSIQNTLLTIINEKIFRNAGKDYKVPLKLLISASNELPEVNQGLEALFDRFIIRYVVCSIANEENFNAMIESATKLDVIVDEQLQITNTEYHTWLQEIAKVKLSDLSLKFISRFRKKLYLVTEGKAYISDRRWNKIAFLMKASAFFNARLETDKPDWIIVVHCIWDTVEQQKEYASLFYEVYTNALTYELKEKQEQLENRLDKLNEQLNKVQLENIKFSVYTNPFKGQLVGNYHRLLVTNKDLPICFLSLADYQKIRKNFDDFEIVKLSFGKTLNQLNRHIKVNLSYHTDNKLIDSKKNIYPIEIEDLESTLNQVTKITKEVDKTEKEIKNLTKDFKNEKDRLCSLSAIFFDEQYKMILDVAFNDLETIDEEKFDILQINS